MKTRKHAPETFSGKDLRIYFLAFSRKREIQKAKVSVLADLISPAIGIGVHFALEYAVRPQKSRIYGKKRALEAFFNPEKRV